MWVRPGAAAPAPAPATTTTAAKTTPFAPAASAPLRAAAASYTPSGEAFLPVGVKRRADASAAAADPDAHKRYRASTPPPDAAALERAAKAAEAKAALEKKLADAREEAEKMKAAIKAAAARAKEKKEAAARDAAAAKELEKKEAALEKANKAKKASNLLSGFAAARKKQGVGTAEGAEATLRAEAAAAELTPEERERQAVRRVMMAGTDWQILNLPPDAQAKWVKQSYRELAKGLHPDKCKAAGGEGRVSESREGVPEHNVEVVSAGGRL